MNFFNDIWKPFENQIHKLEKIYQLLSSLNDKFSKFWEILEKASFWFQTISNFLPDYFLVIFLTSLLFLFLINNFLPQTPRFNFTISVLLASCIFLLFQVSFWKISLVAFLLICPFYLLGSFLNFVKFHFQKFYYKRKIGKIPNIEEGVLNLQNFQREFLKEFYQTSQGVALNKKLVSEKLKNLKSSVEKLEELLEK